MVGGYLEVALQVTVLESSASHLKHIVVRCRELVAMK